MPDLAQTFHQLHDPKNPLLLANVWDAGSARLFESLGAKAIATTSAGVSWAHGYPDGDAIPLADVAAVAKHITRIVKIPLSVDFEGGYSDDPAQVGENIKPILDAGAVGINLEDGTATPELTAEKIEAVRNTAAKMGIDLYINTRTDVYLREQVAADRRADETIVRAAIYQDAGSSGLFVPALTNPAEIRKIASKIAMPLNVLAWPGLEDAKTLSQYGVARVSAGSGIPQVLWKHAQDLAENFLRSGGSKPFTENYMSHAKLQQLFVAA